MYIKSAASISSQATFDGSFPTDVLPVEGPVFSLVNPTYKDYISGALVRRMGAGVKYGMVASALALKEAGEPELDAILTGTGVGCIKDSENFLTAILENDEQYLTPTAFIQSTHNTVGAQIAVGLGCKAYNFTYVNGASSFEAALLDAHLQFLSGEAKHILVGGVDEKAEVTYRLFQQAGLITNGDRGASYAEGAHFFVLTSEGQTPAEILDVAVWNTLQSDEVAAKAEEFLANAGLGLEDIDAVILGINDDPTDQEHFGSFMKHLPQQITVARYKHLIGEYNTASGFAVWLAHYIAKEQVVPSCCLLSGSPKERYKYLLLYNQYRGADHSFILVRAC
jgi:3-oxoacyl-[acyl-carrier-protein] synthase II